jgi:hypothetical protein
MHGMFLFCPQDTLSFGLDSYPHRKVFSPHLYTFPSAIEALFILFQILFIDSIVLFYALLQEK